MDPKVGATLVEKCVCGALEGKTRIVVTHRLNFVKLASKVLFFEKGKLAFSGNYEDFSQREEDLAKISAEQDEKTEERKKDHMQAKEETKAKAKQAPIEDVENLEFEEENSGKLNCRNMCKFTSYSCGCATLPLILVVSLAPARVTLYISEWIKIWMGQ